MPEYGEGHKGERRLAETLNLIGGSAVHLWFGVDYLPSVPDLDVLLWHGRAGVFAIEVKAIDLSSIESAGLKQVAVRGRSRGLHPLHQAKRAVDRLVGFLGDVTGARVPFIQATACFPLISRQQWQARWPDERMLRQARGMLFSDDLIDEKSLLDALTRIKENPAIGPGSGRQFSGSSAMLDSFIAALDPGDVRELTAADASRLDEFASAVDNALLERYPPDFEGRVLFSGDAGTGKTYRLLHVAVSRAMAGQDVLFITFNKVLAADLRRWVSHAVADAESGGAVDVVDAWQFLNRFFDPVPSFETVYDEVANLVLQERRGYQFDTVCIDEAQDMADWVAWLASWCARDSAAWFVARGLGQELYAERTGWIGEFALAAQVVELTTVFRTGRADFTVASLFARFAPDTAAIPAALPAPERSPKERKGAMGSDQEALFDAVAFASGDGSLPRLMAIPDSSGSVSRREQLITGYSEVISAELETLKVEGTPGDLMILVPGKGAEVLSHVRLALARLGEDAVDLADSDGRRALPRSGVPRILTVHSSRGMEASRVVVLGFQRLANMGPIEYQRRLGYIALSRAKVRTTVVLPEGVAEHGWEHVAFLDVLLARMRALGWS